MLWIPNLLTACNLISGFASILCIVHGNQSAACGYIMLSCFFDGIDGKVAYWLDQESNLGAYFDSLSDMVSFGVVPAFFFIHTSCHLPREVVATIALTYISCGIFRLVRFHFSRWNISPSKSSTHFRGLPITASAFCFASLNLLFAPSQSQEMASAVVLLVLSGLMVSHLRFFNPKNLLINRPAELSKAKSETLI